MLLSDFSTYLGILIAISPVILSWLTLKVDMKATSLQHFQKNYVRIVLRVFCILYATAFYLLKFYVVILSSLTFYAGKLCCTFCCYCSCKNIKKKKVA